MSVVVDPGLSWAIEQGIARANARMTETVIVFTRAYGTPTDEQIDPPVTETELLTSPARIRYPSLTVSDQEQSSQFPGTQDIICHLPSGTQGVVRGMLVRVLTSTADATLVGRVYTVKGNGQAGQTTALRVPVEES